MITDYMGRGGVYRDPQKWLYNIWMTPNLPNDTIFLFALHIYLSYAHHPKCEVGALKLIQPIICIKDHVFLVNQFRKPICSPISIFTFVSVHPTWINLVLLSPLSWICPAQVLWTRKFYEIWLFPENVSFDPTRVSSCLLPFLSQCSWQKWHLTCWWTPRTAPSLCSQPTPCHEGCFSSDSPT